MRSIFPTKDFRTAYIENWLQLTEQLLLEHKQYGEKVLLEPQRVREALTDLVYALETDGVAEPISGQLNEPGEAAVASELPSSNETSQEFDVHTVSEENPPW